MINLSSRTLIDSSRLDPLTPILCLWESAESASPHLTVSPDLMLMPALAP